MSQPVPNVPYNSAIVDQAGKLTSIGISFFRSLYLRIGGANALSNTELEALSSGAALQAQITALTSTVATLQESLTADVSDLGQGPIL